MTLAILMTRSAKVQFLKMRGEKVLRKSLRLFVISCCALTVLCFSGCRGFFEKESTEAETRETLDELSQVKEIPEVNNTLPEQYLGAARRMEVGKKVKLFYYTKHHSVGELAKLVKSQLGYNTTSNEATNQLIVTCPSNDEADKALDFLRLSDVPPIQVKIDCLVVEQFADVTMDWETKLLIENFLGEDIRLSGKDGDPDTDGVQGALAFPGAALREPKRQDFGLNLGFVQGKAGHRFRALIDMLVSRGYLKVLMNPTIETINSKTATVTSREWVPLERIVSKPGKNDNLPFNITNYQWVTDELKVTPHVYSDGSIGLVTDVTLGSKSKPEGVVQISVLTERKIEMQENRIAPGQSLVVGGLRKSERRSVIRGVPFFKDLPLVGVLFSSKDFEEKATELMFILTPTISSGGKPYDQVADMVREKHSIPRPDFTWKSALTEPLGGGRYTEQVELKAKRAELARLQSELEKAETEEDASRLKEKLLEKAKEVMQEKRRVKQARQQAATMKAQAEKSKKQAQQSQAKAEKTKQQAQQDQEDAEEAAKDAEKKLEEDSGEGKKSAEDKESGSNEKKKKQSQGEN